MKFLATTALLLVLTLKAHAVGVSSFVVEESTPSEYDQLRLKNIDEKEVNLAWMSQPRFLSETNKNKEYGYLVESIFIYDPQSKKAFYIYSNEVRESSQENPRGIMPKFKTIETTKSGLVTVRIETNGTVVGILSFDSETTSLDYKSLKT